MHKLPTHHLPVSGPGGMPPLRAKCTARPGECQVTAGSAGGWGWCRHAEQAQQTNKGEGSRGHKGADSTSASGGAQKQPCVRKLYAAQGTCGKWRHRKHKQKVQLHHSSTAGIQRSVSVAGSNGLLVRRCLYLHCTCAVAATCTDLASSTLQRHCWLGHCHRQRLCYSLAQPASTRC